MLPVRPERFEVLRFGASARPRGFQARERDAADPDPSPLSWASRLCAWRLRPACEGACVDSCPSFFFSFIDVLVFSCLVYRRAVGPDASNTHVREIYPQIHQELR